MKVDYEENTKRSLICRGCAGRTLGQDYSKCCCQENKFVNVLKNHYVEGTNINQLREMLELTQGCENFCEKHGFLYEFILTKRVLQNGESKFDNQELYCKLCIKENKDKLGDYDIELLNDDYWKIIEADNNQQDNSKELSKKIDQVFEKMKIASQDHQKLQDKKQAAEQRKKDIIEKIQLVENQNQHFNNYLEQGDDQESRDKLINQLNKLKNALDLRVKAIAFLENGYHDYLHDEYLESESVRKKIMDEDNPMKTDETGHNQEYGVKANTQKGYPIETAFKYFDDIQFI